MLSYQKFGEILVETTLLNFLLEPIYPTMDESDHDLEFFRAIIACLLIYGADANCTYNNYSPLARVVGIDHANFPIDIIRAFVIFGADVNKLCPYGMLSYLCHKDSQPLDEETLNLFLGTDID